ncbi:MAG: type III-B CRISPR module-associated Cmr3 family protein [Ignavibacteria bacterium]|jgi:CRISPR-associated protein Cmr3
MSKYYIITFTPLGRFFFGSSQSWGESFYAKSLEFPTQTTILGCLRRTLLKQNNLLDEQLRYPKDYNDKKLHELTGASRADGFNEEDLSLGIINKMSPVFISRFEKESIAEAFLPVPSDVYVSDSKLKIIEYKLDGAGATTRDPSSAYKRTTEDKLYPAKVMDSKQFWDNYLNSSESDYDSSLETTKIIKPISQPGIARKKRNKIDKEFYRKKDFLMESDYAFSVIVEFAGEIKDKLKDDFVFLGGEQSKFNLKIIDIDDKVKECLPQPLIKFINNYSPADLKINQPAEKIVLVSHLFLNGKLPGIKHSVTNHMGTIRSLNRTGHKTQSYRIIPSGSVLYIDKNFKTETSYKFASKIGYNFFIEVN